MVGFFRSLFSPTEPAASIQYSPRLVVVLTGHPTVGNCRQRPET